MHADGKSTLASVSKWNSGKVNWWSFSLYLMKLLSKMVGWKEQEPETELSSTSNFQSPILKLAAITFFWYGLKPALLTSHTLVDPLI